MKASRSRVGKVWWCSVSDGKGDDGDTRSKKGGKSRDASDFLLQLNANLSGFLNQCSASLN